MTNATNIQPELTMRELLELFPGAQRALFRKYHIGGCSSCGFQPAETLAQVCARNDRLPLDEVIAHIEASHAEDLQLQVAPGELARERDANPELKLVDIRTREEFDAARIDGSIFFTQEMMQEILATWDRSAAIVIVDQKGARSMDAAAYFAGHGFTNIKSLRGGIDAWSREVDPDVPQYDLE